MNIPPIFAIDGYKLSHRAQYPDGTNLVYSNLTPRTNKHFTTPVFDDASLLWVGTQTFLTQWLVNNFNQNFFQQPKTLVCGYFKQVVDSYLGPDSVPVDGIEALHDLGYLPLEIKALPEGSLVEMKVPVLTVKNTKPEFFWLVNYLETLFSSELWPVATAATTAFNYRILAELFAEKTCDDNSHLAWQCHDFAARGNMGMFANSLTGLGHLASFSGSDSVFALVRAMQDYAVTSDNYLYAGSVPATEHSVMCAGEQENEIETFRRLITETYPSGIVSIVSDTWDYWQVIQKFLPELKEEILSRNGKVVIRPDSGDPTDIICGRNDVVQVGNLWYPKSAILGTDVDGYIIDANAQPVPEHEVKGSIELMWEIFGGHINSKGFKVLDPRIGLIYGDSITLGRAKDIFQRLAAKDFASSNVVLGIGSFTYQFVTRDTFGFAIKATYVEVDGKGRAIQKDPKTDDGTKKSLKGLMHHTFDSETGRWSVKDNVTLEEERQSDLPVVFLDGKMKNKTDIAEIRGRVEEHVRNILKTYPKDKL